MIEQLVKELGIRCPYFPDRENQEQAKKKYHMLEARIRADERRKVLQELNKNYETIWILTSTQVRSVQPTKR